jgi:uncharacterized membrane protein YoaK (UPF0700 family)
MPKENGRNQPSQAKNLSSAALAMALIAVAGWVDAAGYLQLGGLFVSFMSGNSTQLGVGLGRGQWLAAAEAAAVIAVFVLGAFAGELIAIATGARHRRAVLLVEALLLGAVLVLPHPPGEFSAAALPMALALGIQNAALHRVGTRKVSLTYVTGTLVRFGQQVAAQITGRAERGAWRSDLAAWLAMVAGAVAGAIAFAKIGLKCLAVPAVVVVVLAVVGGSRTDDE